MKEENSLKRRQPTEQAAIEGSFGAPRSMNVFFENDVNHKAKAKYIRDERRKNQREES